MTEPLIEKIHFQQLIEPGFPLKEGQTKILNGGFRLDVATTPTYCTQLLRSGLDLRTVQQMMGHSDIASTMRYLRPQEHTHTRVQDQFDSMDGLACGSANKANINSVQLRNIRPR
jgi:hypothetical protein